MRTPSLWYKITFQASTPINTVVSDVTTMLLSDYGAASEITNFHNGSATESSSFLIGMITDVPKQTMNNALNNLEHKVGYLFVYEFM